MLPCVTGPTNICVDKRCSLVSLNVITEIIWPSEGTMPAPEINVNFCATGSIAYCAKLSTVI